MTMTSATEPNVDGSDRVRGLAPIDLDHNATTRPHPEVLETIVRVSRDAYANPGSRHAPGRAARRILESCREKIAGILGAHPDEVFFTSGGTESNNLAVLGATEGPAATLATTAGEHPSVWEPCRHRQMHGWQLQLLDVDRSGRLLPERFEALNWDELRCVALILAHNETGVIQETAELAAKCQEHRVPLHLDAVQAVGKIPVNFQQLNAATLSVGSHKFHGPRGVGALLIKRGYRLNPILHGGHQEEDRRPGTEAVSLISGMTRALELFAAEGDQRRKRMSELRDRLQSRLQAECGPAIVNGADAPRLPNTLSIAFPGLDGEALLVALDLAGVCCSLGSTCASGSAEPAPALVAMGCPPDILRSSIRLSLGIDNSTAEIEEAANRITRVVNQLRTISSSSN